MAASLLLPLASCTDTATGEPDTDARAISFTPAAETRAAVDGTTLPANSSFKVWGWYDTDKNVFNGNTVTNTSGAWTYDGGTQYWIKGKTYNFYGVYPAYPKEGSETTATVTSDGTITVTGFNCSATGADAVDLMTATATGLSGDVAPTVAMEFKHQLSKVNIVATVEGGNCTVTSVTFSGMATQGSYNSSDPNNQWTTDATKGSFMSSEEKVLNTTGVDLLGNLLLIPQTVSGFTLTVDYTVGGVAQPQKVITLPTTISQWEKGQSYKYTLSFKRGTLTVTVKVADWKKEDTSVSWG